MIVFWNRHEAYVGFSIQDYCRVRDILIDNKIKYISRTSNHTPSGHGGRVGINLDYALMYYIYVHKRDAEKVRAFI